MRGFELDGQLTLLVPESLGEKPLRPSRQRKARRNLDELISVPYLYMDLTPGHGDLMGEPFWEVRSPWRENGPPLNTGVAPRKPIFTPLSSVLVKRAHRRYYLSRTACLGILRRAKERGKQLPPELEMALKVQAGIIPPTKKKLEIKAFHINQRDEGIDLHGVSGALMATANMQMQTFVTQASEAIGFDGYNGDLTGDVAATLGVNCGMSTGRNGVICPVAFAANQRDEVRDLHNVAGALSAQPGMKQQTFVASFSAGAGSSAGGIGYSKTVSPTLKGSPSGNCMPSVLCLNDQGGSVMECSEDVTGTLRAQEHGHQPCVYENHGIDSRYTGPHPVVPTMSARYGTGGNNVPLVAQEKLSVFSRQRVDKFLENDVVSTESARQHKDATDLVLQEPYQDTVGALTCGDRKGPNSQYVSQDKCVVEDTHLIRRLTPLECDRLQGYPDDWTSIPGASDSARYKALGNSVAIPCVEFIMHGIALSIMLPFQTYLW